MRPVTVINRIQVKLGKMDEFIEVQRKFAATLPSDWLVGGRMYRSIDGQSAVLVSTFASKDVQTRVFARADFKEHLERLQPFVESSSPLLYEEAYTTGDFGSQIMGG